MKKTALALLASMALLLLVLVAVGRSQAISDWLASLFRTGEISIGVSFDPATGATIRVVENHEVQNDEELVRVLRNRSHVVIRARDDVPWKDVVHVMDLCKQAGIEDVQFSLPLPRP